MQHYCCNLFAINATLLLESSAIFFFILLLGAKRIQGPRDTIQTETLKIIYNFWFSICTLSLDLPEHHEGGHMDPFEDSWYSASNQIILWKEHEAIYSQFHN